MVTDPIGDFLTRIKNAIQREKDSVELPSTKMIEALAKILKEEGFILDYKVIETKPQNQIEITLKYVNGESAIREVKRISKPGIRKYRGYKDIKPIKNGLGLAIFSTPNGIITGLDAVKQKVGGEYICEIY